MFLNTFRDQALREAAQSLTPVQRQLLANLSDRGPGLLMELAVRLLTFPEQIGGPLRELQERGLVRGEPFSGGLLGSGLYFLTEVGRQAVAWLQEEAARGGPLCSAPAKSGAPAGHDFRLQKSDYLAPTVHTMTGEIRQ